MEMIKNMLAGLITIGAIFAVLILVATNGVLTTIFVSVMVIGLALFIIYVIGSLIRMYIKGDLF